MSEPTVRELNQSFIDRITSDDSDMQKQAADDVTAYTRVRMREDGFFRRILPPTPVTNTDLDRQVDSVLPSKVVDREPDSPAAVSIPFATLPMNHYIVGDRYRVDFARIVTPRFTTDIEELRTWTMDIRQVLSDNSLKDALAEEDGRFIQAVNTVLLGQGVNIPAAGNVPLWTTIAGGITRDTINDAYKVMKRTTAHLAPVTVLANHLMVNDLQKLDRAAVGGDLAEEIFTNGIAERSLFGANWIFTIKEDLVPENTIYLFADPKFLGKFYILEDMVMHVKKEAYLLWWFCYETIGAAIGNVLGCSRVDFTA